MITQVNFLKSKCVLRQISSKNANKVHVLTPPPVKPNTESASSQFLIIFLTMDHPFTHVKHKFAAVNTVMFYMAFKNLILAKKKKGRLLTQNSTI